VAGQLNPFSGVIEGLRTLVFPEICIMCESANAMICEICKLYWIAPARKVHFDLVPTFSVVEYNQEVSNVILKAKEERNRNAQKLISIAIHRGVGALLAETGISRFVLAPIPSSRIALRKRGESFLHPIMNRTIEFEKRKSRTSKTNWQWVDLLKYRKEVRDQAGLSSYERNENLKGAFSASYDPQCPVILVDDVITTGATLKNAVGACRERNMTVLGAVTACASPYQLLIR
jgi:predicted amidophosphoribosyltransferase